MTKGTGKILGRTVTKRHFAAAGTRVTLHVIDTDATLGSYVYRTLDRHYEVYQNAHNWWRVVDLRTNTTVTEGPQLSGVARTLCERLAAESPRVEPTAVVEHVDNSPVTSGPTFELSTTLGDLVIECSADNGYAVLSVTDAGSSAVLFAGDSELAKHRYRMVTWALTHEPKVAP
jgi:hypothetical protein